MLMQQLAGYKNHIDYRVTVMEARIPEMVMEQSKGLIDSFIKYADENNEYIKRLEAKIPKEHEIQTFVHKENKREREQMQDLRDSTRNELKKLKEVIANA